jgi:hypothetical protein
MDSEIYLLQGRGAILFSTAESRLCSLRCSQELLDLASVFIARSWGGDLNQLLIFFSFV